jgi:hypothetical protein
MLTVLLFAVILIGLAIGGIAIKMLLQKDGQFSKTCSSIEFSDGEKVGCVCGDGNPEGCVNYAKHHPVANDFD